MCLTKESGLAFDDPASPFKCKYCGAPSWIDPSDQIPPPDYCHDSDHGSDEDRAEWAKSLQEDA